MNRCIKCRQLQSEPAGKECGNPIWHDGSEQHYSRTCEFGDHCQCYDDGGRCCSCRDRKL